MSRLRERMITSLQVEVLGEDHETESCGRLLINNTQGSVFVVEKDKEIQDQERQMRSGGHSRNCCCEYDKEC